MQDIKEFYKEEILNALAEICVNARVGGYNEGLKAGMNMAESKCSNAKFDYDKENKTDGRVLGTNDSNHEYKSEINKDLGILGE